MLLECQRMRLFVHLGDASTSYSTLSFVLTRVTCKVSWVHYFRQCWVGARNVQRGKSEVCAGHSCCATSILSVRYRTALIL